jgi:hypothetical protein
MTDNDYARKLDELDHLLNDPSVPMPPTLTWCLHDEVSEHALQSGAVLSRPTRFAPEWRIARALWRRVESRISTTSLARSAIGLQEDFSVSMPSLSMRL